MDAGTPRDDDIEAQVRWLRTRIFPARLVDGTPQAIEAAAGAMRAALAELGFEEIEARSPHPAVLLLRLGGPVRAAGAILANVLVQGGGHTFDISYHLTLERVHAGQVLLVAHGIDPTHRTGYDPEEALGSVFAAAAAAAPAVIVGPWFDAETLPESSPSSRAGFRRLVGEVAAFWWT